MNLPMSFNGPACTRREIREGVPLSYVSEKLRHSIEDVHFIAQAAPEIRGRLTQVMYSQLKAFLALHNMLGAANDMTLPERLLSSSSKDLRKWVDAVVRHGSLLGVEQD